MYILLLLKFIYNIEGELNESYDNKYSFSQHASSVKNNVLLIIIWNM